MTGTTQVQLFRCAEMDDLASHLEGFGAVAIPLPPQRCGGMLLRIALGDVTIQILGGSPMLMLADASDGATTLLWTMDGAERARWDGLAPTPRWVTLGDGARQHVAFYPQDFVCLMLTFRGAAQQRIAALQALDPTVLSPEAIFAGEFDWPRDDEAAHRLRDRILEAVGAALAAGAGAAPTGGSRARQHLVHAADEYLRASPERAIYTEELCSALGTSATRLGQAFRETFGISPHRYLKLRRLGMVRAVLLSRSGPWHSVKAAALSHGFWHLGQFSHDYREVYGELPSETLARATSLVEDLAEIDPPVPAAPGAAAPRDAREGRRAARRMPAMGAMSG